MNTATSMRTGQRGITLMELLVVMVIVGILAAVGYPSYRQQVMRSKRTDAKVTLQQASQALENCFTRFNEYDNAGCAMVTTLNSAAGLPSGDGNYKVTVNDLDDLSFTLVATPQGGQVDDTGCGNFTLDQNNQRGVSGGKGVSECWK